jgi:short-subunit dehydrogenase
MKTAILTGATAGLGTLLLDEMVKQFPDVDRYVLIARRRDRLEALQEKYPGKCIVPLSLDLTDPSSFDTVAQWLAEHRPDVRMLVNNAGLGTLGDFIDMDCASQTRMVDLNVRALTAMTNMAVQYMDAGSRILNVSSIASFCPNPRMTVYSATKAYVTSYTVGLSEELKSRGIGVTAVCPGPMDTEFLSVGKIRGNSRTFELLPYCDQVKVAGGALRAARNGQTIYTPKLFYKFYRCLAKVTPVKLMVKFTKT